MPSCAKSRNAGQAEEEAQRRAVREAAERAEREAAEARRKAEDERHRHEDEAKRKAETEAKKRFGEGGAAGIGRASRDRSAGRARTAPRRPPRHGPEPRRPAREQRPRVLQRRPRSVRVHRQVAAPAVAAEPDEDEAPRQIRRGPGGAARPAPPPKDHSQARPAERAAAVSRWSPRSTPTRCASARSPRSARRTQRLKGHASNEPKEKLIREVIIPEAITIQELANRMAERAVDVIRMLMKQGAMHKITDVIDADTAQLIAEELGHTVKRVAASRR
ncbi:hypothetical protein BRDID11002_64800 [Bradyrhizobium diazoefficiens]